MEPLPNLLLEAKTNAIDYSLIILDWSLGFRERSHTRIHEKKPSRIPLLRETDHDGRNFAIEPILLVSERRPGVRHARKALVRGLSLGALSELKTVVGIIPEDVRLFHLEDVGTELSRRNPLAGS
ncbi:hypothetical protein GA0061098_1018144 [Bradyrhizobium shewense]|uniref:Uncharacterized protein n=1 Tax=Bradyrhizobium shewense TaxID=1761772 RepID=A0A1C3XLJ4_9BRAD|nr:hypothetical protein GA0061098_1018144 [Bradyrhizobium shewense]